MRSKASYVTWHPWLLVAVLVCGSHAARTHGQDAATDSASTVAEDSTGNAPQHLQPSGSPNDPVDTPTNESAALVKARTVVARGEALFAVQNYEAALAEFVSAYELMQGDPRQFIVLNNIAVCHERMFRYELAARFYQRYLDVGGARVTDRPQVEAALRSLYALLATLTIESNISAEVWIDNRRAGDAPGSVLVAPGRHVIELRATIHESERREVNLAAGSALRLRFDLAELSRYTGLHRAYFFTFAGLTAAALIGGGVLGVRALILDHQGAERSKSSPYLNTIDDEAAVRRTGAAADIAFASGAVLGASTIVLFLLTNWVGSPTPHQPIVGAHLAPYAGQRAYGVELRGSL